MKILIIIPHSFVPPNSGPKNLIFNLIKFLHTNTTCDLVVLSNSKSIQDKKIIKDNILNNFPHLNYVQIFSTDKSNSWLKKQLKSFLLILSGYPPVISKYDSQELIQWLNQDLSSKKYDIIHFDMFYIIKYWKYFQDVPKILVPHDAYSSKLAQINIIDLKTWLQSVLFRILEKTKYHKFDLICPVSEADAKFLKTISPNLTLNSVPIAVADEYLKDNPRSFPINLTPKILCTCTAGSLPQVTKKVFSFLEKVYPKIIHQNPPAKFTLLGKYRENKVKEFKNQYNAFENIQYVEDYLSFLKQDWIYVYPQTWGAGLKTKIQQAMALGLPVVGTPNAFSGLNVENGKHCFIAENDEEFENSINLLCQDVNLRERMGKEAHELMKKDYSIDSVGKKMMNIYNMVIHKYKEQK